MPVATEQERRAGFVQGLLPYAARWERQSGIPAAVLIAIAAHESNFGNAGGNMLFGIKGPGMTTATHEIVNGQRVNINDSFRTYPNPDAAFSDFLNLVSGTQRYTPAWQQFQKDGDVAGFLSGITRAGYATDQSWGNKIMAFTENTIKPLGGTGFDSLQVYPNTPSQGGAAVPPNTTGSPTSGGPNGAPSMRDWATGQLGNNQQELDRLNKEEADLKANPPMMTDDTGRPIMVDNAGLSALLTSIRSARSAINSDNANLIKLINGQQIDPIDQAKLEQEYAYRQAQLTQDRDKFNRESETAARRADIDLYGAGVTAANGLSAALGTRANTVLSMLQGNRQQRETYANHQVELGKWNLQAARDYLTATDGKAATALKLSSTALEAAGFIQRAQLELVDRLLPADVQYQPGFEPNGGMAQLFQRMGLNATLLPVKQVDASTLDPRRTLADTGFNRYMQQGADTLDQYDRAAQTALTNARGFQQGMGENDPTSPYYLAKPTDITAEQIGLQTPQDIAGRYPGYVAGAAGIDTTPIPAQTIPPFAIPSAPASAAPIGMGAPLTAEEIAAITARTMAIPNLYNRPGSTPEDVARAQDPASVNSSVAANSLRAGERGGVDRGQQVNAAPSVPGNPTPGASMGPAPAGATPPPAALPPPGSTDPRGFYQQAQSQQPADELSYWRQVLNSRPRAA